MIMHIPFRSRTPGKYLSGLRLAFFAALFLLLLGFFLRFFDSNIGKSMQSTKKAPTPFSALTNQLFYSEMTNNTLNLHYTLAYPQNFGISRYRACLPCYTSGSQLLSLTQTENLLHLFSSFPDTGLSEKEQTLRRQMIRSLENSLQINAFPYYEEPLSPSNGMQSQLPILLAEYTFRTLRDVEDYLHLLNQTDEYFASLLLFEQEKAAKGLQMSASSLEKVIGQCDTIVTKEALADGTHFLQVTFRERLQPLLSQKLLSAEAADKYIVQNEQLLSQVLLPAYQALGDGLSLLKDPTIITCGLSARPQGAAYYQDLIYAQCGSSRSVPQIKALLLTQFQALAENIKELLVQYPSLADDSKQTLLQENFPLTNAEEMLTDLQERMRVDFPVFPGINASPETDADLPTFPSAKAFTAPTASVKSVSESLQDYCAPAFYLTPPLDDISSNAIYINEKSTPAGLELYTTLAHEGYPGHMYQTVYHNLTVMEDGIDQTELAAELLWYGGYLEGWALYVEFLSYDYAAQLWEEKALYQPSAPLHASEMQLLKAAISLAKQDRSLLLCLYSLLDIMIHYENASLSEITDFLHPLGITDSASVAAIYEYIANEPANYLKYYLGYLEILTLQKQAKALWGQSYSDLAFHTFFLENGPADFDLLTEKLREWELVPSRSFSALSYFTNFKVTISKLDTGRLTFWPSNASSFCSFSIRSHKYTLLKPSATVISATQRRSYASYIRTIILSSASAFFTVSTTTLGSLQVTRENCAGRLPFSFAETATAARG